MRRSNVVCAFALLVLPFSSCSCEEDFVVIERVLAGPICFEDGTKMIGAHVVAVQDGKTADEADVDDTGQVELDVLAGLVQLTASKGDVTRSFDAVVSDTSDRTVIEDPACRVQPPQPDVCTIVGNICNRHTGEVVQAGEVYVLLPNNELATAATDDSGQFTMTNLPEGQHTITIRAPGFQRSFLVECVAGETTTLNYGEGCTPTQINEGNMEGHFCDPTVEGSYLIGATVTAVLSGTTAPVYSDITDTDGNFFLNALPPGTYNVNIVKAGVIDQAFQGIIVSASGTAIVPDQSACADLQVVGAIEGRLCADEGGGFYMGRVSLRQIDQEFPSVMPDDTGRFRFPNLVPGPYTITLLDSTQGTVYPVEVVANQTAVVEEDVATCVTPPVEVCEDISIAPTDTQDGRILLVVDRSGSMDNNVSGSNTSKWEAMRQALTNVTAELEPNVDFGLVLYPSPETGDQCAEGTLQIPMGTNSAALIGTEMQGTDADGATPTARSLLVAKDIVQPLLADGRPIAVLLATDGNPNCNPNCGSNCEDKNGTMAAAQQLRDIGVLTYVVGVESGSTLQDVLNQLATIGGTALPGTTKYYRAENEDSIKEALRAIVQRNASCVIEVPQSLLSASSVTVTLGGVPVTRDVSRTSGWDIVSANSIELYGAQCDTLTDPTTTIPDATVVVHRCEEQ